MPLAEDRLQCPFHGYSSTRTVIGNLLIGNLCDELWNVSIRGYLQQSVQQTKHNAYGNVHLYMYDCCPYV